MRRCPKCKGKGKHENTKTGSLAVCTLCIGKCQVSNKRAKEYVKQWGVIIVDEATK